MTFRIIGLCGSLRQASFNAMALRAAAKLAPGGMSIETFDIATVPMFNDDLRLAGEPPIVSELKARIRSADAVLLVSPEYNFSIPGVLKNTLDWLSRPPGPPFDQKPVAIMGAATGPLGTARMQYHLRQVLVFMNAFTVNKPEVFISHAASKFDEQGELTDQATAGFVQQLLDSLHQLALRVAPAAMTTPGAS